MKTREILKFIADMGGFDNFRHWNKKQKAEWVKGYFECSTYVANNVAAQI